MSKKTTASSTGKRKQVKSQASTGEVKRGNGGELHQTATGAHPELTTNQGVAISDNQNSLRSHARGPTLLEDFVLREKITHFDHERIPERIVHARGTGMHGFFELTSSLKQFTTARILTEIGEKTPVFTRISTVAGGAGSVDTPRDVRGFAVKFYTKEGNWDLVGNNIPVFFIQDAIKFPDLIHAVKMEPDRGFPQSATAHDTFWDYISLTPESMHMVMWIMSDRTIPIFTQEEAESFPFDHLDPTKLIPEELVPLKVIGRMVLNRWPDNFFAETEQVAYCPGNIVPGIDFSNDPLLQGRLFSYIDTQLSRLGSPNFHQIPINAPKCPFGNHQRDGHMPSRDWQTLMAKRNGYLQSVDEAALLRLARAQNTSVRLDRLSRKALHEKASASK